MRNLFVPTGCDLYPGPPCTCGARRRILTSFFRLEKRQTPSTWCPYTVQKADGPVRQPYRPAIPSVRLCGIARCRAGDCHDGIGRRGGGGGRRFPQRPRRKIGLLKVRLYRPFSVEHFVASLPSTVKSMAVLDRTKEPGATGEPLYMEIVTALAEGLPGDKARFTSMPRVIGGRYGLSSKEFTPAMAKAVFEELGKEKAEEALHCRHHRRRNPHEPGL